MNFFAHQDLARAKSRRMVWLFVLAVLLIVAAINLVVLISFGIALEPGNPAGRAALLPTLLASSAITLAVIGLGSLFKTISLRSGGGAIARSMGGTLVAEDPRDFHLKRLRNVVEEMSIAAGMPVPEIYVLDRESGINAFAAGFASSDAAIAVTRGALDRLSRDELQGVIAHEFSHILNGDMRLNLRLMGLIFGLLVLGLTGRKLLEHLRFGGSRREGNALLLIALAVMVFGYLGVFLGRLIKAYISRQREFLADASAVQFTRLSSGLAGALMKIGAFKAGSKLTDGDSEEVAHMLFGDGLGYGALTATHPPLIERIKRIDPGFDPQLLARLSACEGGFAGIDEDLDPPAASALLAGLNGSAPSPALRSILPRRVAARAPAQIVDDIANPGIEHVDYAVAIRQSLPPILATAAHRRERAIDVVLCLLVARENDCATALAEISLRLGPTRAQGTEELIAIARGLHPAQRMPLAQLALPALKRRPAAELRLVIDTIETLIHSDGSVDVFEYALARLLRQQLSESLDPSRTRSAPVKLIELRTEALALLAILAQHGNAEGQLARRAFNAGAEVMFPGSVAPYVAPDQWMATLDRALPLLDCLAPVGKETLVLALATTVAHDGQIAIVEAELLRLTCTLLHCPLPPLLGPTAQD